jgi:hypothetical protein
VIEKPLPEPLPVCEAIEPPKAWPFDEVCTTVPPTLPEWVCTLLVCVLVGKKLCELVATAPPFDILPAADVEVAAPVPIEPATLPVPTADVELDVAALTPAYAGAVKSTATDRAEIAKILRISFLLAQTWRANPFLHNEG